MVEDSAPLASRLSVHGADAQQNAPSDGGRDAQKRRFDDRRHGRSRHRGGPRLYGACIGIAAVSGFAWRRMALPRRFETLEAMAENVAHLNGLVVGAMDARRAQVYNAVFEARNGTPARSTPDRAISLKAGAQPRVRSSPSPSSATAACFAIAISPSTASAVRSRPRRLLYQNAVGVGLAAERAYARGEAVNAQELLPVYLRPAQAERLRNAKPEP